MPKSKPSEVELVAMAMYSGATLYDALVWRTLHPDCKKPWRTRARAFLRALKGPR